MIRAVLDANIHASALIQSAGPPGKIFTELIQRQAFRLVSSIAILEEVGRCLFYPKVRKRIPLSDTEIRQWVAAIAAMADIVTDDPTVTVVADDPDDNKYVSAALHGQAAYIVSGDRHLLDMREHEGILIVRPAIFLGVIAA